MERHENYTVYSDACLCVFVLYWIVMVFENLEGTICFLLQNGALNPILFAEVCKVDISVFESTIMTVRRKCIIFLCI